MNINDYLKNVKDKRGKNFILSALSLGIKIEIISSDFHVLKFSKGNKKKVLYNDKPYFNKNPGVFFAKNKELTKKLLRPASFSVPLGIYAKNFKEAISLMRTNKFSFPVVVKPIDASDGICVSVGIKNKKDLSQSIKKIGVAAKKGKQKLTGLFLVEELISSNDFRILVLNNKIIACAQRVPAFIIGDGKNTIINLIKRYNSKRPPSYLLKIDKDILKLLKESGLKPTSVLGRGRRLQLRKNANISSGGLAIDKTGEVSRRFRNIAKNCIKALGLNYAGIDIMTEDITSNNPQQPYYIIEVNGNPEYEPHGKPLISGKGVNVSRILVHEFMSTNI